MSTVCRNCRVRVQRLQEVWKYTPISSGSRKRAPGILRSQHGLPYNIHNRRTDLSVLECRRRGPVSVSFAGKNRCVSKGFSPQGRNLPGFEPIHHYPSSYRCNRLEARAGTSLLFFLRK
jgi:hypothetical protein